MLHLRALPHGVPFTLPLDTYLGRLVGRLWDHELVVVLEHHLQVIYAGLAGHWVEEIATIAHELNCAGKIESFQGLKRFLM